MTDIYIIKCGNSTPLGERAGVTAASVRAGFSMISLNAEYRDESWNPIRLSNAEYLNKHLSIEEQFGELALPALEETLTALRENGIALPDLPIVVGMPEQRPGLPPQLQQTLRETLLKPAANLNIPFRIDFVSQGHTACLTALRQALNRLSGDRFCIVGGVDSYNTRETIEWLEQDQKRLFCSTNREGFIPGQAAGFVLLATEQAVETYQLKPLAKILGVALAEEENSFETGRYSTARALSQTIRQVLEAVPAEAAVDNVYSTLNGEKYHAREYAYTLVNLGRRIKEVSYPVAPHTQWGDLGAAAVPVLMGLITEAGRKGYAKGPLNLITAANLGRERASALVELLPVDRD